MEKAQKTVFWAVILSETTHIFCCVLPTMFSIFSLLAGFGVVSAMPAALVFAHETMHGYELPVIMVSALILGFGWGMHFYSLQIDCRDTGCGHVPCTPKKSKTRLFLNIASALFAINLIVYLFFHQGLQNFIEPSPAIAEHAHDH